MISKLAKTANINKMPQFDCSLCPLGLLLCLIVSQTLSKGPERLKLVVVPFVKVCFCLPTFQLSSHCPASKATTCQHSKCHAQCAEANSFDVAIHLTKMRAADLQTTNKHSKMQHQYHLEPFWSPEYMIYHQTCDNRLINYFSNTHLHKWRLQTFLYFLAFLGGVNIHF